MKNLSPEQVEIITEITTGSSKFVNIVAGRQSRKTSTILNAVMQLAKENSNLDIAVFSPTYVQSTELQSSMVSLLRIHNVEHIGTADNNCTIIKINNTLITFKSANDIDLVEFRGYSHDYIFLDNCAGIKTSVFYDYIMPLSYIASKVVSASIPAHGRLEHFHALCTKASAKTYKLHYSMFDDTNPEYIANKKSSLSRMEFATEFDGLFTQTETHIVDEQPKS